MSAAPPVSGRRPIGLQLYTLRRSARVDFEAVLGRVAQIGFEGVEFDELHGVAPERLGRIANDLGLTVIAAHAQSDLDGSQFDEARALGAPILIDGGDEEDFGSKDDLRRLADRLNAAVPLARERGMTLGYHNHEAEFSGRIGGRVAYDVLMEELDPQIVAEVDIFWTKAGGSDPLEVVRSLGDRVRLLHVKDGDTAEDVADQTPVGAGSIMDIPAILASNPAVRWHIVELDRCAMDPFDAVTESYRYLAGDVAVTEG